MERLRAFIEDVNSTNKSSDKKKILKKYENDDFIKKILFYTYHPYKQYFVSSKNLKKHADLVLTDTQANMFEESKFYDDIFVLLDDLANGKLRGNDAIASVNSFIAENEEYAEEIYRIFDRNLQTRLSEKAINEVFEEKLIPTFDVALAEDIKKTKHQPDFEEDRWFCSRKLDGIRLLTIIRNGKVQIDNGDIGFRSRNGKPFHTLSVLEEEIKRLGIDNCVLDGEICLIKSDGSDDFNGILCQIQRKNHTIKKPRYKVFDILTLEEFDNAQSDIPLSERLTRLPWNKIKSKYVTKLDQWIVKDYAHLAELKDLSAKEGWEGLILRKDSGYVGKRSTDMLKVKKMFDAEYEVIDTIMDEMRVINYYDDNGEQISLTDYRERGGKSKEEKQMMLAAVFIEHKGNEVKVGSGWSRAQREEYYEHPERIIGKTITVQYFEETTDKEGNHSLRFPVVKAIYKNGRNT